MSALITLASSTRTPLSSDAVGALDVRLDHVGVVHAHAAVEFDLDALTVERGEVGPCHHVLGPVAAGSDVVGEDCRQHRLVLRLQQRLNRAGGQLGERLVGRGEHGERTLALQRVHEARSLEGGGQSIEGAGADSGVDDVRRSVRLSRGLGGVAVGIAATGMSGTVGRDQQAAGGQRQHGS
jgi:hypothetical protein